MRKKMFPGLCSAVVALFGLVGSASVYAKDLGSTIKIPDGGKVQLGFNGNFTIKVAGGGPGLSGTCACAGRAGTCEVTSIDKAGGGSLLVCHNGKAGTCKSRCSMTTNGAQ